MRLVFGFRCYFWVAILEDGFPGGLYSLPVCNTGYIGSIQAFLGGGSNGKECACNVGDLGSISGLGRSLGGGHGNPLHYSCLENPHGQRQFYFPSSLCTRKLSNYIWNLMASLVISIWIKSGWNEKQFMFLKCLQLLE